MNQIDSNSLINGLIWIFICKLCDGIYLEQSKISITNTYKQARQLSGQYGSPAMFEPIYYTEQIPRSEKWSLRILNRNIKITGRRALDGGMGNTGRNRTYANRDVATLWI